MPDTTPVRKFVALSSYHERRMNMGTVIIDMSMSLDGFIAGPKDDDKPDRELVALDRLHDWMFPPKGNFQEIERERFQNVGAVVMGRRMFNLGQEPWGDDPPFHMPVFVLTHNARDPLVKKGGLPTSLSPMESRVLWHRRGRRQATRMSS